MTCASSPILEEDCWDDNRHLMPASAKIERGEELHLEECYGAEGMSGETARFIAVPVEQV